MASSYPVANSALNARAGQVALTKTRIPVPVFLLIVAIVTPREFSFSAGDLLLSPYRVFLLAAAFPVIIAFVRDNTLRFRIFDLLIIGYSLWVFLSFSVNHGLAAASESGGIAFVETVVPYFLARTCVRNIDQIRATLKLLLAVVLVMLPFTVYEAATGQFLIHEVASSVTGSSQIGASTIRLGISRAFGTFDHPIMYGTFCASILALCYFSLTSRRGRFVCLSLLAAATYVSASSGPFLIFVVQSGLMAWENFSRKIQSRWMMLGAGVVALYSFVAAISNRSVVEVFISYLTLNSSTAWTRIVQWNVGSSVIAANPWFGVALHDYDRPRWLSASIDSFWLFTGIRFGLVAVALLATAVITLLIKVGRNRDVGLSADHSAVRFGWMFSLIGLVVASITVHYWKSMHVYFFFFIGMGAWLAEHVSESEVPERDPWLKTMATRLP